MKQYFKSFYLIATFLLFSFQTVSAKESDLLSEMPQTCQNIQPSKLTFGFPLSIQNVTLEEKQKIHVILDDALTQACILQLQYDGLIQQIIATLLENNSNSEALLKPFEDQLVFLIKNQIDDRVKTVLLIQKAVSEKKWSTFVIAYTHFIVVQNDYIKQQIKLQKTYNTLIGENNQPAFTKTSLWCVETHPKIQMVEQIFFKLPLTNIQKLQSKKFFQGQEEKSCYTSQQISKDFQELLKILPNSSGMMKEKRYQTLLNQLIIKEYLLENYQIKTISFLLRLLTREQKLQLKEQYILLKSVL